MYFSANLAKFMDNTPQYPPPGYAIAPPPQQTNAVAAGGAGGNPQLLADTASLLNTNSKF